MGTWRGDWGIPDEIRGVDLKIKLSDGKNFDATSYIRALEHSAEWLAATWPRMSEFARSWRTYWKPAGGEYKNSLLSFAMQEYEAASLAAKIDACKMIPGAEVINLQHDGVIVATDVTQLAGVVKDMQQACEQVLGYEQPLTVKKIEKRENGRKEGDTEDGNAALGI